MADDELNPNLDPANEQAPEAEGESSPAGDGASEDTTSDFNMDEFRASLESTRDEAISRAEFESVKRQAGQTRALQRELAELKEQLAAGPKDAVSRAEMQLILDAVSDLLPEDRRAAIEMTRAQREAESAVEQRLAERDRKLLERLGIKDEDPTGPDPEAETAAQVAAVNAQWQRTAKEVISYAQRKGVTLTQEDLNTVQAEVVSTHGWGAADKAAEKLVALIEGRASGAPASGGDRSSRVAERKSAAEVGTPTGATDGAQGRYDLNTLSGLAKAKQAGAIDSAKFIEHYRRITSGM